MCERTAERAALGARFDLGYGLPGDRGSHRGRTAVRALIVADGDVPSRSALDAGWPGWADDVELIVAPTALDKAAALGLRPALLVGDADSLPEDRFAALAAQGVPIERSPAPRTSRTRSWRSWPLSGGARPT